MGTVRLYLVFIASSFVIPCSASAQSIEVNPANGHTYFSGAGFSQPVVDLATARVHAQVWGILAAAGMMIGPHDLWMAATCIAHGLTMVTANVREFTRVPGLTVEVWHRPG